MLRALESNGDDNGDLLSNPCGTSDYDTDLDYHLFTTTSTSTPSTTTTMTTTTPSTTTTPTTAPSTTTTPTQYFWDGRNFGPAPDERMRYIPGATRTSTAWSPYQPLTSARPPANQIPGNFKFLLLFSLLELFSVFESYNTTFRRDSPSLSKLL